MLFIHPSPRWDFFCLCGLEFFLDFKIKKRILIFRLDAFRKVAACNIKVRFFELASDELSTHIQRYNTFRSDSGKRGENQITWVAPHFDAAFNNADLQWADMALFVLSFASL